LEDAVDAVGGRQREVTVRHAFEGGLGALHPVFLLPSLPFLANTTDEARRLYQAARPANEPLTDISVWHHLIESRR
jgi:TRAP-type transport system periplasmic protein